MNRLISLGVLSCVLPTIATSLECITTAVSVVTTTDLSKPASTFCLACEEINIESVCGTQTTITGSTTLVSSSTSTFVLNSSLATTSNTSPTSDAGDYVLSTMTAHSSNATANDVGGASPTPDGNYGSATSASSSSKPEASSKTLLSSTSESIQNSHPSSTPTDPSTLGVFTGEGSVSKAAINTLAAVLVVIGWFGYLA